MVDLDGARKFMASLLLPKNNNEAPHIKPQKTISEVLYGALYTKERELEQVKKEVAALRLVAPLLYDKEDAA